MGKKNFISDFRIVYVEDHSVLFGLYTLRYLGLFVGHLLVFIESIKIRPVHKIKGSDTQTKEETLQELERSLEVPKVWVHDLLNTCQFGALPAEHAQGTGMMAANAQAVPTKTW